MNYIWHYKPLALVGLAWEVSVHLLEIQSLDLGFLAIVALMFPDGLSVGINTCKIIYMGIKLRQMIVKQK